MSSTSTATNTRSTPAAPPAANQVVPAGNGGGAPATALRIGEELKARESQFKAALPAHIPLERFMRVVMTAIQRNSDLAQADRASLFTSSIQAAQDGLLPDGREGALVIYNSKVKRDGKEIWVKMVQWMPMIAGIRKKVRNSGEIATWDAQVVHEADDFEFELGDDPFIKHRPYMGGDRGPLIAAYSIATLKSGEKSREVMTVEQIESVRARSKQKDQQGNPTGPWKTDYAEMCRKTVARRHSKVLPMSTDLDDLIRRDDELYDMKGAREQAVIANGGKPQSLTSRLDVLAGAAGREDAPLVERQQTDAPHDPATGEIKGGVQQQPDEGDEADGGDAGGTDDAGAGKGQPASAADETEQQQEQIEDSRRNLLMNRMRGKAEGGVKALNRGFANLIPADNEVLSQADRKYLMGLAEDADREKAGADA